jgi:hypothetical protein
VAVGRTDATALDEARARPGPTPGLPHRKLERERPDHRSPDLLVVRTERQLLGLGGRPLSRKRLALFGWPVDTRASPMFWPIRGVPYSPRSPGRLPEPVLRESSTVLVAASNPRLPRPGRACRWGFRCGTSFAPTRAT